MEDRMRAAVAVGCLATASFAAGRAAAQEPTKQECVAANESAQDLQRSEKLLEARGQLQTCAAKACPRAVRQDCTDRLHAIESALPTVTFVLKDAGGEDATRATLTVDGVLLPAAPEGTPIPIDPGQHTLTFALQGRAPVIVRLSLNEGDRVQREVLFRAPVAASARPATDGSGDAATGAGASASPREAGPPESHTPLVRRIGWTAIGAGAAGVVLGSVFGFIALAKKGSLKGACQGDGECPPSSQSDIEALHVDAVAANISFGVGILGLGTGTALLLLFPETPQPESAPEKASAFRVRPWVGVGNVGMLGSFP
jgi:hypothetical protein